MNTAQRPPQARRSGRRLVEICGLVMGVLAVASVPKSAQALPECAHEQVNKARRAAEALARGKDWAGANRLLDELQSSCDLRAIRGEQFNLDFYWVQSDASLYLFRLGKIDACRSLLGRILTPRPPDGIDMGLENGGDGPELDRVRRALQYNSGLCDRAVAARRQSSQYESKRCPHPDKQGIAIPPAGLPPGIDAGCLELEEAAVADYQARQKLLERDTATPERICPQVVAHLRRPGKGWQKRRLRAEAGKLANISDCCNLEELSVAVIKGQTRVSVSGAGRDCFGGTAYIDSTSDYVWKGNTLTLVDESSVAEH